MPALKTARLCLLGASLVGLAVVENGVAPLQSNLCKFLKESPVGFCPEWLQSDRATDIVFWVLIVLLIGALASWPIEFGFRKLLKQAIPQANISFQKFVLFWVDMGNEAYQVGTGIKIFNFDDRPQKFDEITVELMNWTLVPRGRAWIKRILQFEDRAEIIEDNHVRAGAEAYFKRLLPIKFQMDMEHGATPELILRGPWTLVFNGREQRVNPPLYSVYERPLSKAEWGDLLKSQSDLNLDDLHYKEMPERPDFGAPDKSFLLFHPDQTAIIENPYFAQTPPVRGHDGVMVFVRGKPEVPVDKGWQILGSTYHEVWSNPEKLALYNALFPPGEDGLPRAFGFIAGAENEMAGPVGRELAAPTTRAADIMDVGADG